MKLVERNICIWPFLIFVIYVCTYMPYIVTSVKYKYILVPYICIIYIYSYITVDKTLKQLKTQNLKTAVHQPVNMQY